MTKVDQQEWALCVSVASIAPSTGMVPVKASTILAVQHRLDEWAEKAATWMASPEAAQRLQGYREVAQQVAKAQNERDEARAIANDRDAMVDHRDRALTAMYQRVDVITRERDEAIAELETERLRLAACGVVAMANTPESAARVRDILPVHFSASLHSVMGAVDREMELRAEVERLRSALRGLHDDIVEYQRINHLGGYDNHWMLAARAALAATEEKT